MPVRGRRPLGSPDARRAVLDAARELFAELGFERTTMRAVAARAGVDAALIYHYFGDKDGLLFAALQPPADAATVFVGLTSEADRTGEELVRRLIGLWEDRPEVREQMVAIIRAGLSHDRAAGLLREILSSFILAALGDVLADDRRELRVALIGSHIGGLMLARYILQVPGAAAASPEDLVRAVGPTVQRYLTGDIGRDLAGDSTRGLKDDTTCGLTSDTTRGLAGDTTRGLAGDTTRSIDPDVVINTSSPTDNTRPAGTDPQPSA